MLANVFAKTLRDRWLGWAIASGVLGSFILLGMVAYEGLDISFLDHFPEAYKSLIGIGEGMDAEHRSERRRVLDALGRGGAIGHENAPHVLRPQRPGGEGRGDARVDPPGEAQHRFREAGGGKLVAEPSGQMLDVAVGVDLESAVGTKADGTVAKFTLTVAPAAPPAMPPAT